MVITIITCIISRKSRNDDSMIHSLSEECRSSTVLSKATAQTFMVCTVLLATVKEDFEERNRPWRLLVPWL